VGLSWGQYRVSGYRVRVAVVSDTVSVMAVMPREVIVLYLIAMLVLDR